MAGGTTDHLRREQYRWAGWAAILLALLFFAGCGADGRGAGDRDGAAYPESQYARLTAIAEDIEALWTAVAPPDWATEGAHSAAWLEALDGLADAGMGDIGLAARAGDAATGEAAQVTPTAYVAPSPTAPSVFDTSCAAQIVLYDWPVEEALYVMSKESGGDPWALNPSGACGCFQMLACVGYGDPVANVAAAYGKWQDQANHMGYPGFHWHWFRWWP